MAMMGSEMHTAVQRERFQLQGVPVGSILRHPGASGDTSRTQRSVNAPKAAGDTFYPLQFGWYHGSFLALVPIGTGAFLFFQSSRFDPTAFPEQIIHHQ